MNRFSFGVALILFVLVSIPAFGQSANATLSGTVTDATGGVLPGVRVEATHSATGVMTAVVTNAAGVYNFPSLQPGVYKVTADMEGFQKQTFTDVTLRASAQVRLNVTLQVRQLAQEVEVTTSTESLILDSSSSVGTVLSESKVAELPLVNNNVLDLVQVMGGTVLTDQNPIFNANDSVMAGVSAGSVNIQRDGVTINEVRYESGMNSALRLNNEMIGEFKVLLAPVDAEAGRGNGQIQVLTKSGGNEFHGGLVWNLQNTALDSNQYHLNRTATEPDWRNVHEYTASFGGPLIKNKTFFFVMWNQQVATQRRTLNSPVLTPCARKGIFRYFDNWVSGNVLTTPTTTGFLPTIPAVDATGKPVAPATNPNGTPFTGQLRAFHVFGQLLSPPQTDDCSDFNPATDVVPGTAWDLFRNQLDQSGYITRFTNIMPPVNNYEVGDGLNTAGNKFTLRYEGGDNIFGVGEDNRRRQINVKIDHNFNDRHRISGSFSYEKSTAEDAFKSWPNGFGGSIERKPRMLSVNLTSAFRPTLLNEFRIGLARTESTTYDPIDDPSTGASLKNLLQTLLPTTQGFGSYSGLPIHVNPGSGTMGFHTDVFSTGAFFSGMSASNPFGSRGNLPVTFGGFDPRWTIADNVTWTKGKHAFRWGGEIRIARSYQERTGTGSFVNDANVYVSAIGGATPYAPVQGINAFNMPGIVGFSGFGTVGSMEGLLNYQAGSLANVRQYLFVNSPTALTWSDYTQGDTTQVFDIRMKEFSLFFKDDWKITDDLTLNLGMRYEYYGVPFLDSGMTVGLDGGSSAIFGISGRSFDNWLGPNPPTSGDLSRQIFVGPNSPNSSRQVYGDDWNNFSPAVGFAWQIPWFGKGKTTLRGGYQINYLPIGRADTFAGVIANTIGTRYTNVFSGDSNNPYLSIANLSNFVPVPIPPNAAVPLALVPITARNQPYTVFDENLRNPYVQNLTLALSRSIGNNLTLDVRYVGTLTRKALGTINLNSPSFLNNGLLEAFNAARTGGESALLDQMFQGVNIQGFSACGPVGALCNGVLQTGAGQLRNSSMTNSSFTTYQSLLANGNYSALASALATANYNTIFPGNAGLPAFATGENGVLLRFTGMPENFIFTNPQFSSANFTGNLNYSNYHSMQAQVTLRPTRGVSFVSTYTWGRNLGLSGTYTNPLDRAADYALLSSHRSHQLVTYGTFDLPFGKNRLFFKDSSRLWNGFIGGWQMSWITNLSSGSPNSITAASMLYANGVPDFVGPEGSFDTKMGMVAWTPGAAEGNYFGSRYIKVRDPQCSAIDPALQGSCTLQAIALASDPGVIVFQNPQPGTRGNFGRNNLTNLGRWNVDAALSKAFRVAEGKSLSVRVDATNVFNHPTPSLGYALVSTRNYIANNPDMSLNTSDPFGLLNNKVGNRTFQCKVRFDF